MTRRVYLASSWRNAQQPALVEALRADGHEVYDFRNPPNGAGFGWEHLGELDTRNAHGSGRVTIDSYLEMVDHEIAQAGFAADYDAMRWADTFVLALPCGRSAHLEAGWAIGQRKPTAIFLGENPMEPELMYRMADYLAPTLEGLLMWLRPPPGQKDFEIVVTSTGEVAETITAERTERATDGAVGFFIGDQLVAERGPSGGWYVRSAAELSG